MFESVLLPAPFSPSSACTSPSAASKSTPSFATTPGKLFRIPRMATAAPFGAAVASSSRSSCSRMRLARGGAARDGAGLLPLRAADHALHEPVHRVEVLHRELLALRHHQLAGLVVERPRELVERAALDRR